MSSQQTITSQETFIQTINQLNIDRRNLNTRFRNLESEVYKALNELAKKAIEKSSSGELKKSNDRETNISILKEYKNLKIPEKELSSLRTEL